MKVLNSQGSVSLLSLPLFLILIAYLMISLSKSLQELRILQYKTQSYLCIKYVVKTNLSYLKFMSATNTGITGSFYLMFVPFPKVSIPARYLNRSLIAAQQLYQFSYLKDLSSNKYCKVTNIAHALINTPVKGKGPKIRRSFDNSARIKSKWTTYLNFIPAKHLKPIKYSFTTRIKFKYTKKGLFSANLYGRSKEYGLQDLPF